MLYLTKLNPHNFFHVRVFLVSTAKLSHPNGVFASKPDPYLEFSVDGKNIQKTEIAHRTLNPTWNQHFVVYAHTLIYSRDYTICFMASQYRRLDCQNTESRSTEDIPREDIFSLLLFKVLSNT